MGLRLVDNEHYLSLMAFPEGRMLDHTPPYVYTIQTIPDEPPRLVRDRKTFSIAEKKYGKHSRYASLVINDYDPTMGPLGAIAIGLKGSGKSLLCEEISNWALQRGMPIIMIDKPYKPDFLRAMARAVGPCVLYFDEFGKIYRPDEDNASEAREMMLAFFSDTSMKGVINLVTANNTTELSEYMLDRPGRFKYRFNFNCISCVEAMEVVKEYNLKKELQDAVMRTVSSQHISWDMLRSIVQVARESKDLEDYAEKTTYLNVPKATWPYLHVTAAYYHDRRLFSDEVWVSYYYPTMKVAVLDDEQNVLEEFEFNIEDDAVMGEFIADHRAVAEAQSMSYSAATVKQRDNVETPDDYATRADWELARVGLYRNIRPAPHLRLTATRGNTENRTGSGVGIRSRAWERDYAERKAAESTAKTVTESPRGKIAPLIHIDDAGYAPNSLSSGQSRSGWMSNISLNLGGSTLASDYSLVVTYPPTNHIHDAAASTTQTSSAGGE